MKFSDISGIHSLVVVPAIGRFDSKGQYNINDCKPLFLFIRFKFGVLISGTIPTVYLTSSVGI